MIECGDSPNDFDGVGLHTIHHAAMHGRRDIIDLLFEGDASEVGDFRFPLAVVNLWPRLR